MSRFDTKVTERVRQEYRSTLQNARVSSRSVSIGNRYPWHCQLAIIELVEHAIVLSESAPNGVTIRILTGKCPDYVFAPVMEGFERFLRKKNNCFKLFCWTRDIENIGTKLLSIRSGFKSRFEVKFSGTDDIGERLSHFLVVNDQAYRVELPHAPVPPGDFGDFYPEIPARINFNDRENGQQLVTFFDDLWKLGQVVS